ncbi:hypothetical protein [Streptomyces arenae]|uniref:hypothetical protein n=1 Tax=Streptomyces arenae TaxID=29301 RepID=UPI002658A706|nr:hypothetical protein [Streptomyces arenae]MCG7202716.1 hypothetical protein [Streptomyces arenae]
MYVRARAFAASGIAAALLTAGAGGAVAATTPPSHQASITVKASPTTVMAGQTVRFTGHTSGIRPGASVRLQMDKNGKWIPVHVNSKVKKGDTYVLATRVHMKGSQQFRVASGQTRSSTVTVTVQ